MRLPYFLLLLVAQLWHPYRLFPVRWLWAAARVMVELEGASACSVLTLMEFGRRIREGMP
jgi:hypothetical protein